MTLAQNHPQPLNGNRFLILVLSSILFSVSTFAQINDDDDDVSTSEQKIQNPYQFLDSISSSTKSVYNIAFVLPIIKNNIKVGDGKNTQTSMPYDTREALGFWEGVTLAMGKIKNLNSKFNIHIWDNSKDDSTTISIVQQFKNNKIDAVIAPFHTKQAVIVSEYCKKNKIPMFLVQNPSDVPAKNNPFAFKFHIPKNRIFYEYYQKITSDISETNTKIYFVYDATQKSERKVFNYLKFMAEKDGTNRLIPLEYKTENTQGYDFKNKIDSTYKSIFIISYHQDNIINEISSILKDLNNPNINLFVQSSVTKNYKVNKANLESLNTFAYSDFLVAKGNENQDYVKKMYFNKTKDNIVSDVFLGYDVANYITELFDRYGVKFPLSIDKYKHIGIASNFLFRPQFDSKGNILFFENMSKFMLRATQDGWYKVD